jgi:hypothetical protein
MWLARTRNVSPSNFYLRFRIKSVVYAAALSGIAEVKEGRRRMALNT